MIAETFSVERAYIYVIDNERQKIIRYKDLESNITSEFPITEGLVGLAIQKR